MTKEADLVEWYLNQVKDLQQIVSNSEFWEFTSKSKEVKMCNGY